MMCVRNEITACASECQLARVLVEAARLVPARTYRSLPSKGQAVYLCSRLHDLLCTELLDAAWKPFILNSIAGGQQPTAPRLRRAQALALKQEAEEKEERERREALESRCRSSLSRASTVREFMTPAFVLPL
eukprot:1930873-Pleurochrysis_carterae.AAC.2